MPPRRNHHASWLAVAIASVALGAGAHANGRAPYTNGVYFQPNDNQSIYVRTTFGLFVSHDAGCSFRWTCEDSIGYGGTFDPDYAVAADGSLYATTYAGLRISRDGGCTFAFAPAPLTGQWVDGIDLGSNGDVWVVTSNAAAPNDVFRSTDGGVSFASAGLSAPATLWSSILVAPSDPMHVYVTGFDQQESDTGSGSGSGSGSGAGPIAHLFSTTDAGSNWTASPLAGVEYGEAPRVVVAAVDPTNAQNVFVVSVGQAPPGDALYRSTDGGATLAKVLATSQPIVGVVILDASTVYVAAGTNAAGGGAFRSTDGGATFTADPTAPQLVCLGKRPDGTLVGCANNWDPDFMAVTTSSDGTSWQKVMRFAELDGVLDCPAGTIDHDDCDQVQWPSIQAQYGVIGPSSCPSATDVEVPDDAPSGPSTKPPAGCCGAGDGSPIGFAVLAVLVVWIVGARTTARRRHAG